MIKHFFLWFPLWLIVGTVCADCQVLRLVETQSIDNIVSNQLAKRLFAKQGYHVVSVPATSSEEAYKRLSLNEADAYLSTWIPLNTDMLKPYVLSGKVRTLGQLLSHTQVGIAGNAAAETLGIISLEQLKAFGEALNYTVYFSPQDWLFAQELQRIINNDVYQLSGFRVQSIQDFDLNDMLQKADKQQKPIVFFTRQWSDIGDQYAKHFLYDTLNVLKQYQAQSAIYSSVRYQFPTACPKQANLLKEVSLEDFDLQAVCAKVKSNKRLLKSAVDAIYDEKK